MRRATGDPPTQQIERVDGGRAANAIAAQAGVQLVFRQRRVGAGPKMAIDAFLVEAEFLELLLQLGYIISHLHVARFISQYPRA